MTMFKVEELEAGPLLDQAVLLAMGATRALEPPADVPDHVRERWPEGGCLVLVDGLNMAFYGSAPPFSTDWGVGGPLVDKRKIMLQPSLDGWEARVGYRAHEMCGDPVPDGSGRDAVVDGDTALVSAMRALVLSQVGPTIELRQPAWNVGTPTVTQGPPR